MKRCPARKEMKRYSPGYLPRRLRPNLLKMKLNMDGAWEMLNRELRRC